MISSETGYATALLKTALELGNLEQVCADLPVIDDFIRKHARYFFNPKILASEKERTLTEAFSSQADALSVQFAALLAQRRRLKFLSGIRRQFEKISAGVLGKSVVHVWVPFEMNEELLEKLKAHLVEKGLYTPSKKGETQWDIIIDKSVIGGFVAESEGRRLDMSLKTRLARLRRAQART